jgi:hypothetical protein
MAQTLRLDARPESGRLLSTQNDYTGDDTQTDSSVMMALNQEIQRLATDNEMLQNDLSTALRQMDENQIYCNGSHRHLATRIVVF